MSDGGEIARPTPKHTALCTIQARPVKLLMRGLLRQSHNLPGGVGI